VFNRHAQLPAVALSQDKPSKHPARIELAPRPWQSRVQPQHLGRIWQIELSKNRRDQRSEAGGQKNLFISDLRPPTSHLFPSGAGESRTHNVLLKRQVQLPFCFNPRLRLETADQRLEDKASRTQFCLKSQASRLQPYSMAPERFERSSIRLKGEYVIH
jgi:hypothetical protein